MKRRTPAVDTISAPTVEMLGEAHGARPPSGKLSKPKTGTGTAKGSRTSTFRCTLEIEPMTKQGREKVKWMLAHLKPLDEWLATTDKERLNACSDILGEPVEFYHKFKAQLERLAAEGGL